MAGVNTGLRSPNVGSHTLSRALGAAFDGQKWEHGALSVPAVDLAEGVWTCAPSRVGEPPSAPQTLWGRNATGCGGVAG